MVLVAKLITVLPNNVSLIKILSAAVDSIAVESNDLSRKPSLIIAARENIDMILYPSFLNFTSSCLKKGSVNYEMVIPSTEVPPVIRPDCQKTSQNSYKYGTPKKQQFNWSQQRQTFFDTKLLKSMVATICQKATVD